MLYFNENGLTLETDFGAQTWSIPELLETPNPLYGQALAERNAGLRKAVEIADAGSEKLSETAALQFDFWKNFQPAKIPDRTYIYPTSAETANHWELTINRLGLYYKDLSSEYDNRPGWVSEQLFSDFWFYGPLQPIPELKLREKIIASMREGFLNPDCPAAGAHFELFEYPPLKDSNLYWSEGDYKRTDFISVRSNGIETGCSTWRDTQPAISFISFERFLHEPPGPHTIFKPEIRAKIEQFLGRKSAFKRSNVEVPEAPKPPTPREKMDLADALLKANPLAENSAEALLALLEYEAEDSYWRNFVFNYCGKLRGNKRVQNFIVGCLQGDNEVHFKKAVDVLSMWGIYGDKAFQNRALLLQLNWDDATANDPNFREALEVVLKKIPKTI
jgi:hypothetical protein